MNLLQEYRELIKDLQMEDKIELTGKVENVDNYLIGSKIFAFTSTSEGFPNSLGEALRAGLACVSYDCVAGPSDMIKDGSNGYLVKVGDEDSFRKKLEILMSREDIRASFSKNARESMSVYEVNYIADKFYKFISQKD
jgi:GalNAc-alpha-(1->4)-GalNAc-alpha-(1->3)-diNAcBac-PP-undecaprenol alpha-1,4-N-acetyl-D-galactosaminyltransferase